jgi:ribosomal protein L25 (general stress protein Ctc)
MAIGKPLPGVDDQRFRAGVAQQGQLPAKAFGAGQRPLAATLDLEDTAAGSSAQGDASA